MASAVLPRLLTVRDFEQLKKGQLVHLGYCHINQGHFYWRHERVEEDRVFGQFAYYDPLDTPDMGLDAALDECEVDDFLYEFQGHVCRGSGAEPVFFMEDFERFANDAFLRLELGEAYDEE